MEDSNKKVRSPQFPFIALSKAVARASEFEAQYHSHAARIVNAVKVWGYAEKSSGGIQTIAALAAYALLEDEGRLETRKLKLSVLAHTILKDARPGAKKEALKTAALKPRVLLELWNDWGASRPPDRECISILHLDKKYTEDAATRLLKVYDDTIRYAGLAEGDSEEDNKGAERELDDSFDEEIQLPKFEKVPLMENERVVFAHELRPNQSFRVIVRGELDKDMVSALKKFAEFQELLVKDAPPKVTFDAPA